VTNYLLKDRNGQTPLPIELRKGLKIKHITNMTELDEYEEDNIFKGLVWLEKSFSNPVNFTFWIKLHKKLFSEVWDWAGQIRSHELQNQDFVLPYNIRPEIKTLENDLNYWIENKTFEMKEIAARFHERIETIHPFNNGNGRFGRIIVQYFCQYYNIQIPTWGKNLEKTPRKRREHYIKALVKARKEKIYSELINLMYS